MAGFGDIWGAVNEGTEANQALVNNYWHNQAQQALAATYGPMAGNPQAALQMQQYNYLGSLDPELVQAQQLANTGTQIENTTQAGLSPSKISAGQSAAQQAGAAAQVATGTAPGVIGATNATNTGVAQTAVPAAQAALTQQQNTATQGTVGTQAIVAQQHVRAMSAFTSAATDALNAGQQPEAAFATGRNAALAAGADPADVDHAASMYHDQFVQAPQATLDGLMSQTLAAQKSQLATLSPTQRIELQKAGIDYQKTNADLVSQTQKNFQAARDQEDAYLQKAGPLGTQVAGIHAGQDALANMQKLIDSGQISANGMAKSLKEGFIAGSPEAQFKEYADQASAALSLDQMQALKAASGGSASGIRNSKEFSAAGDALANFDVKNLSPTQLSQQIANAKNYMTQAQSVAENQLKSQDGQYQGIVTRRQQLEGAYNASVGLTGVAPATGALATPPAAASPPSGSGGGPAAPVTPPAGAAARPILSDGANADISKMATYPRAGEPLSGPVQGFVWHHTGGLGSPQGVVQTLNQRGLGVQYVMDRDGTIYRTLPDGSRGAHILPSEINNLNNGNTEGMEVIARNDNDVTPAQVSSAQQFWQTYSAQHPGVQPFGHGELNPGHKMADEGQTITMALRNGQQPTTTASDSSNAVPLTQRTLMNYAGGSAEPAKSAPAAPAKAAAAPPPKEPFPATATNMHAATTTPAKQAQAAAEPGPAPAAQAALQPVIARPVVPTNPGATTLGDVLGQRQASPGQPPVAQPAPQPAQTSSAAPFRGSPVETAMNTSRPTGNETPSVLPQNAYFNRPHEQVMAGRALLAKYLNGQQRTA